MTEEVPMRNPIARHVWLTLALSLAAGSAVAQQPPAAMPPQVVAQGTAEVRAAPDRSVVRFGMQIQAGDAKAAQGRVNDAMQRVIQAVRRLNVPENRISTERLELFPVYDQPQPGREGTPRLSGYRASNVVRVELDATANLGPVIDAAVGAGANTIEGIQFELANEAPFRRRALEQAAKEARDKAQAIATALDAQ